MAEGSKRASRVTIADIARRAGLSKGAVSYALNGRPGVSEQTRARVLAIADELGWHPNHAARSLSASHTGVCGLVIARPARLLALEPFFMELVAGVEAELSARSVGLMLQLVDDVEQEAAIYRRWWAERRVDGVIVVDRRVDDPRVAELVRLGLPAVVVGRAPTGELPSVWHDDAPVLAEAVRHLAALGHRRIAHVAGLRTFAHARSRSDAFHSAVSELGLPPVVVETDYTPESGAQATRRLLSRHEPPTAIVFDSGVLAVTGLGVAQEMGRAVPGDLSIVGWDDSLICQVVHPPLTAVTRDVPAYGAAVARRLLAEIDGTGEGDVEVEPGGLTVRASTGRAPVEIRPAEPGPMHRPHR